MKTSEVGRALNILEKESAQWAVPVVTLMAATGDSPFRVLISCLLSLRTKDETTAPAVTRLFEAADTPEGLLKISVKRLEKLIYPVGFYRNKARLIHDISRKILKDYGGHVPDTIDELLKLKGVGRKTANLVVAQGYGKPAICVDVHVHRITNRWGYVKTKTPEETEFALREKLPPEDWRRLNWLLVAFGQQHCRPTSPHCSSCKIRRFCARRNITTSR